MDNGNQQPNHLPTDLVIMIDEKPHDFCTKGGSGHLVGHQIDWLRQLVLHQRILIPWMGITHRKSLGSISGDGSDFRTWR